MNATSAFVPEPALEWREETPVSASFGDVYFSRAGGVAETSHVFLQGNGLPGRWQGRDGFTIGELGFGTGLNFLVALKAFRETAPDDATLHYVAIEKFPFTRERLQQVLALQPDVAREAEELLTAYPLRLPGIHRINLERVRLTLCIGDVEEMLAQWHGSIDAWFLDGFSPAKNAAMWSDAVLAFVGERSAPDATCATFTAAGAVKRGLQAAGFVMEKAPGFGHKREMLVGHKVEDVPVPQAMLPHRASAIIIGAGIAGATLARALAERGMAVTVLERAQVGSGASGNAAGVLFPQLSKQWNLSTAWYFTAYGFALRQLQRWSKEGLSFDHASPGMLRLPRSEEEETQLHGLNETLGLDTSIVRWMTREEASAQAGVALISGAAFFAQGTWLAPAQLCRALLQHERIMLREESAAVSIARAEARWQVTLASGEVLLADHVCVASAAETQTLLPDYAVRLNSVGGLVSCFAAQDVAAPLRSILCHKGYVIPSRAQYLIGATYHREDLLAVTDARHAQNVAELETILPGWFKGTITHGRSNLRATTPDRMPYIGALDEGLYLSTGHGSRGLLSAPLAAEAIASMIAGEQVPLSAALLKAIDPKRFTKR